MVRQAPARHRSPDGFSEALLTDPSVVAANRALLAANLTDKTAKAIVKRAGDVTDSAAITELVARAAAVRVAEIERELRDADADLA
jgi:hypothetical protein